MIYSKLCLKHGKISPKTCCPELSAIFWVRLHLEVAHQRGFGLRASPLPLIGTQAQRRDKYFEIAPRTPLIQPKPDCKAAGSQWGAPGTAG